MPLLKKILKASVLPISCLVSTIIGHFIYELIVKPDGTLYLDAEDKSIYASLNRDPDNYSDKSRMIFIFKKEV